MKIHERIKAIRTDAGLSQEAFAVSVGLKRANYAQIEAGKQNPTLQTISEIVRIYNKSYEHVIDGTEPGVKTAPNIAPIIAPIGETRAISMAPKVITVDVSNKDVITLVPTRAAAGYLNGYADPEYVGKLPTMYFPGLSGGLYRAFEIRGHSMKPNLHSGSIQVGQWVEKLSDIRDRRVYIIVTKYDGIVCKRVLNRIKDDGKLILISDNDNKSEYPNYPVDAEEILEIWQWRRAIIAEIPEPGAIYNRINDLEARLSLIESRVSTKQLQ